MLWLRTVLFTILVPGTELVLVPCVAVYFDVGPRFQSGLVRYLGLVPLGIGVAIVLRYVASANSSAILRAP